MSICMLCLLLLSAVLVQEGGGVISGPRSRRDHGQQEVRTVDVAGDREELSELLAHSRAAEERAERRLHKRQTSSDSIGHTATLSGDNHNQAVVHWTGYPSEHLFIVTRDRESNDPYSHSRESWLWRSTDYGHHFNKETYKLNSSNVVIEWYYISPRQSNLIFADRIHRRLYITTDEGDSYTGYDIPFIPDRLRFQSIYSPQSNSSVLSQYVLGYDATNRSLWASSNLGSNWTLLGENVTPGRYYWRVMDTTIEGDLTTVYFETAINSTHAQLHYSVYPYSTHDVFDSSLGPFLINSFVLSHEYMFVQKSASTGGSYQSPLWVSHYRKPFRQARFPLQTAERHYSVVDASEGQVFIAVYHSFNNTNLYLSEEQGLNYSLSLEYIISPPESDWIGGYPSFDVHVVEGIVGTYIANRKTPGSQYGATVISFDKGGEWTFLTPPAVTSDQLPIICSLPQCSLHLHMNSDRLYGYQSILSQDSAVGLIMALGNLGSALQRYNYSAQRLYFSHDGGFSWQEVAQNFWEFQFAALGSIVVTVPKWRTTDYVRWSCDEGGHWDNTTFLNGSQLSYIRVIGMLTEIGERAQHVTVFGYTGSFREWLVIDLNFSSVVPTICTADNFYNWIPTDERPGSRCLLGEVIAYERRESDVCCFVDPEYDKPTIRTHCVCAIEDFECDFGFERVNLNSPCTPLPYLNWPPSAPTDCQEGGNYTYTSGYRRVAGDSCVPGNETYFLPVTRQCPVVAPQGLFLSYQPVIIFPGVNVTFDLTQLLGWRLTAHYKWQFGDGSPVVDVVGYASARSQVHMFQSPGTFKVNVTAKNDGGVSQVVTVISVVDPISKVAIVLPGQYVNGSVPSGIVLLYSSQVTTRYGTNVTSGIAYSWDFGDGFASSTPTVQHAYSRAGSYQLTLQVQSNAGTASHTITLRVYQVALEVNIRSSGVMGTGFVLVGRTTTFTATPSSSLASIPSDTTFTWHVTSPGGVPGYTAHTATLAYSFPHPGGYDISVVGNHSAGAFTAQRHLTAEVGISGVTVLMNSTVGVLELTRATLRVLSDPGQTAYTGPLNITVVDQHGAPLASRYFRNSAGGTQSVDLALDRPGQVTISFQAANDVSTVTEHVNLLVVDMLTGVSFILPVQYYSIGAIPTTVSLPFSSILSTRFNTTEYGDVRYDWDFGDRNILSNTSSSNVSHIYTQPGSLQLTLTAKGFSTTVRNIVTLQIYQPVQSSSASIVGTDGVEGGRFVHVDRNISLVVQPTISSQEVPLDTSFTWKVAGPNTNYTVHNTNLSYSFPQQGGYDISITGHHSVGSFTNLTHLTAEIDIASLHVCTVPTVRTFVATTANLTLLEKQGAGYVGLVNISASDRNGTRLAGQRYFSIPGREGHLDLELSQPGDISVILTAANEVSMATTEARVVVVGDGQYGGLVLFLDATPLLAHHSTSDWHTKLKNSIISHVNKSHGVPALLVEVAFDKLYATESPTVSIQSKRQSSEELSLSVEVYILPATYTEDDFNSTMQVAAAIVAEAGAGGLHFMVDSDIVAVQNAFLLPLSHFIVVPAITPSSQDTTLYLGLGLGLGLGLIAVISFSTVMVVVTYYYRRKYSRLHVRYSRLQQGPVRFSFTEHGETVQEEDFADNLSDDDPSFVDDQKLEILRFSQLQEKADS